MIYPCAFCDPVFLVKIAQYSELHSGTFQTVINCGALIVLSICSHEYRDLLLLVDTLLTRSLVMAFTVRSMSLVGTFETCLLALTTSASGVGPEVIVAGSKRRE